MLVVDCSVQGYDCSLLIYSIENEFRIKRYRTHPASYLINPENGHREELPTTGEWDSESRPVFGVITYIINDARAGEFDDCPVMGDRYETRKALYRFTQLCMFFQDGTCERRFGGVSCC